MIITKFSKKEIENLLEEHKILFNSFKEDIERTTEINKKTYEDFLHEQVTETLIKEAAERHINSLNTPEDIMSDSLIQVEYFIKFCFFTLSDPQLFTTDLQAGSVAAIHKCDRKKESLELKHHYTGFCFIDWNFDGFIPWNIVQTYDIDILFNGNNDFLNNPILFKFWDKPLKEYIFNHVIDGHLSLLDKKDRTVLKSKVTKFLNGNDLVTKYTEEEPQDEKYSIQRMVPLYNEKSIRALTKANFKNAVDKDNSTKAMISDNYYFFMHKDLFKLMNHRVIQLFHHVISRFTCYNLNDFRVTGEINKKVKFQLDELADLLGYTNLEPKKCKTPEEQKRANERAKERRKQVRKEIKNNCNALQGLSTTAVIPSGNSEINMSYFRFVKTPIRGNGEVVFVFEDLFINLATSQDNKKSIIGLPPPLLSSDFSFSASLQIGYKLSEHHHYCISSKQKHNNSNKLQVEKILDFTSYIPSYESLGGNSWNKRIKKPFENALNELVKKEVLKKWNYCDKNKPITKTAVGKIRYFNDFKNLYIEFELYNSCD